MGNKVIPANMLEKQLHFGLVDDGHKSDKSS